MATGLTVLVAVLARAREIEGELPFHREKEELFYMAPRYSTSVLNWISSFHSF